MFQGFSQETIDFLWGIRFNNERSWFELHKEEYKTVLETPMRELNKALYEGLSEKYEDLALMSRVCRIYRDARRLHGRGPYKDNLWLTVSLPVERWASAPTFWFEIAPEGYSYGLGYWMAQASTMAKLRARMDNDPGTMEKLVRGVEKRKEFVLTGQEFKRPKEAPSDLLFPWYNKRNGFSLTCDRDHDELLFSTELVGHVLEGWEALMPMFRYLSTLDGDPEPR